MPAAMRVPAGALSVLPNAAWWQLPPTSVSMGTMLGLRVGWSFW